MSFLANVRHSTRGLRKTPVFAISCIVVLALAIGATTAIFGLVDAALIRPLPFPASDRLVMLWERTPAYARGFVAPLNFIDWSEQSHSFAEMAATLGATPSSLITNGGVAEAINVSTVTAGFFDVLGVTPIAGRTFTSADATDGASIVISERLWRNQFGADPAMVGRTVRLSQPFTVVGIMPADFELLGRADAWMLVAPFPRSPEQRQGHYLRVIARLKPRVDLHQASADLDLVARDIARIAPDTNNDLGVNVEPLQQALVTDELHTTTLMLAGVVTFVLLLAVANLANLFLARSSGRSREIAVRAALGGSRSRIMALLLTESILLGVAGGATGIGLAWVMIRLAPSVVPAGTIPASIVLEVNWRLELFVAALTFVTTLAFGLAPAWHASRIPLVESIGAGGRASTGRVGALRHALAIVEVASAVLLCTGAGLLLRTLMSLDGVDAGYRAERVLTMSIGLPFRRFQNELDTIAFYRRVEDEVAAVPGVRTAALTTDLPLDGINIGMLFELVGSPVADPTRRPWAHYQITSPRYFDALGIAVLQGRPFSPTDTTTSAPVCIVNEEFVKRYLVGRNPVGERLRVQELRVAPRAPVTREIVGVIGQVKTRPGEPENAVEIYVPLAQNPWFAARVAVRTDVAPLSLVPAVKAAIARVEITQVPTQIRTMEDVAAESTARPRFRAQLVGAFAALALLLAAVGIFSVLTFIVQARSRELSIRVALGARPAAILRLVCGNALAWTTIGVFGGLAAAFALVRSLSTLLFGVRPLDPVTFAAAAAVLVLIAMTACVAPTLRAVSADPVLALRAE